jgi:hypothetical protein
LKISADYALVKLRTATALTRFPATLDLLRRGEISPLHARILTEATVHLDDATAGKVEAAVLDRATSQTPGLFRRSLNRAVARLAPRQAEDEHRAAKAGRDVRSRPVPDAMGHLEAVITAEDIAAVMEVLNTAAQRAIAAGDPRTPGQLRADTLVDRILGRTPNPTGPGSGGGCGCGCPNHPTDTLGRGGGGRGGGAHVQVTLALSTLTGLDDQPGELAGYGPIPASMARDIAARPDSVWHRLVTDDHGRLLDYGRTTYRPPAALADHVRAFDQRCVFPGCTRRAQDCDLDHLTSWFDGGQTNPDNLAAECPRHHQMKHEHGWSVERLPDGTVRWTSPTGHHYHRPLDPLPIDHTRELTATDPDPPPF